MDLNSIKLKLEAQIGLIRNISPMGGGCIAHACRVSTQDASYFLKWGDLEVSKTFSAEAIGLEALQKAGAPLHIPEVIMLGEGRPGYLLLEWVTSGERTDGFDEAFGLALAQLHRHEGQAFGFAMNNFIGKSPQINAWHDNWPAFFQACRLEPQVVMARKSGCWQPAWDRGLERLYLLLPELLPGHPARSILHGDLWSGNYLVPASGQAALFDPACYYGHRETDLAMTELFGGFGTSFYRAYKEAWPLAPGYSERREIYNLYHLLNHVNLFGSGYVHQVSQILSKFG